jgi:serine/threonine-protein kinase
MMHTEDYIGKKIDQFAVEAFIAKGAMGMVFKAFDSVLARVVALKLIPKYSEGGLSGAELLNREEARKRLIQEAKAAGKLAHPNIVTIHAYGETDEFQYICMEYISGKTLSQLLRERGPLPVEEAIPILDQILQALEAADRENIVHRDIKPSNIMITDDNRVKVMDFGIAKLPSLSMTVTGMVLGTPYYMSPEQISGRKVDIRSDIFSLGAVFYEVLTGEKPFEAESTATLTYKIVQVDPIPPNVVNVHIPHAVARIAARALSKDPTQRYQKPSEMLRELRALSGGAASDTKTVLSSPAAFEKTVLAERPESADTAPETVVADQPSENQASAPPTAARQEPREKSGPGKKKTSDETPEPPTPDAARKGKPAHLTALAFLLALIFAGGLLLWYLQGTAPDKNLSRDTSPQTTQPPAKEPVTPGKAQAKPSVQSLLLEAGRKFTSDPEGAQKHLEEALSLEPNNYDCSLALARLLAYRKDYTAAIRQYEQALRLDNRAPDVHFELGSLYVGQGKWDTAIRTFEACLMLSPRNRDDVLANLGFCHFKKGEITQAQLLLKQSLELNPGNATAKAFLASLPPQQTAPAPAPQTTQQTIVQPPAIQPPAQQAALPPAKEPVIPSSPKLEGNYLVDGTNPNGSKYKGDVVIKRNGESYSITWNISNQIYNGNGTLRGRILTVNYKDAANVSAIVVYGLAPTGVLKGTWANGRGSEVLTPVN